MDKPTIIKGGVAVDDRGVVMFCNDFDMTPVKRMYTLENHEQGFVRAWHGHLKEAKWVMCMSGAAVVAVVELTVGGLMIEDSCHGPEAWTLHPNGDILYIPPGYANGHMNLVTGTQVMHFSSMTMKETEGDDYRFDAGIHGWVWEVERR